MDKDRQKIDYFLQTAYTDERLAALQAHIEDGKFSFFSCCCLVGASNADHPLQGFIPRFISDHYSMAKKLSGASEAEKALVNLSFSFWQLLLLPLVLKLIDRKARKILLPLVRAEAERREKNRGFHVSVQLEDIEWFVSG